MNDFSSTTPIAEVAALRSASSLRFVSGRALQLKIADDAAALQLERGEARLLVRYARARKTSG